MRVPEFYEEHATLLGFSGSKILYRIFDMLYDNENDIKILQALPGNAESISQTTGIPLDILNPKLELLWKKGGILEG